MITAEKIREVLSEKLADSDYFVVDVSVGKDNFITVEVDKAEGITIQECVTISRQIESHFETEIDDYSLEVASPDLSNSLRIPQQFAKNIGRTLKVITLSGEEFTGLVTDANDLNFALRTEEMLRPEPKKKKELVVKDIITPYTEVKSAHIVISFK